MSRWEQLRQAILELGACKAGLVRVEDIIFEPDFRRLCESNACGMYGRSWMCPPDAGPVDELIARAKRFRWAAVFQTVSALEDSYDIEGMLEAGNRMNGLMAGLRGKLAELGIQKWLLLGAGGCRVCPVCAKLRDQPCRHPELALSSFEAYGINVSDLAPKAGMKYINGQNTVTFFGGVLLEER